MIEFILQPITVTESGVQFQMLVESGQRGRAFSGILTMTNDEFKKFRSLLKGQKTKAAKTHIHDQLEEI